MVRSSLCEPVGKIVMCHSYLCHTSDLSHISALRFMTNIQRLFNEPVGISVPGSINKVWDDLFLDRPEFRLPNRGLSYEIKPEEDAIIAEVEVPGVAPEDVKVRLEGRAIHVETPRGNAYFTVGSRVDQDQVTASVKHGLLTLRVPKREARKVEVKVLEQES